MSRVITDKSNRKQMCKRLVSLLDLVYRKGDTEMALVLGYSNTSTLSKVRKFQAFPDVEKLKRLCAYQIHKETVPNLNWIIAGIGKPLLKLQGNSIIAEVSIDDYINDYVGKE